MFLFLLVAAWCVREAAAACTGTISTCLASTCCSGGFGECDWLENCGGTTGRVCQRKRMLANLTAAMGEIDRQFELEILHSDSPIPEAAAHLRDEILHYRKRPAPPGNCICVSGCCPVNCVPGAWSAWSACSEPCGGGSRSRSRSVTTPTCGGSPCVPTEVEACNTHGCPTNCQASTWSGWTCSASCGAGTETRSRYIQVAATNGGACPEAASLSESRACDAGCCPVNCGVGAWSGWGTCSAPCGGGSQSRSRTISPAQCGGSCSESLTSQSQPCNTGCCPQNCVIGSWSAFDTCSAPCGGGSQSRTRSITPEVCGGSCSTSQVSESQSCNTGCCPQNCQINAWSQWSACSQTCGGGTRSRNRAIAVVAACGGTACPSQLSESEACGGSCCASNCVLSAWSSWSVCSVTCGSGLRSRTRTKQTAETCGGTCDVLIESDPCTANNGCCPTNCVWSAFTAWSGCSVTCGAGTQTRTRTTSTAATCGGTCSGMASESTACMQPACAAPAVDCTVSAWMAWSACSPTCGATATKSRARTVTRAAASGGVPCPSLSESTNCGLGCCPVACAVTSWATWSACSVTCGSGMRTRARNVTTDAACSGTPCPTLSDSEACAPAACATACQLSAWSNWSTCSQSCGNGELRRTRSVVVPPANGGASCGALSETQPCMQAACMCTVTAWSTWTPCTVSCGGGMTTRSRNVTSPAGDCPPLTDTTTCSPQLCARDCALSAWSAWSACSVSCGGGRRERTRTVTQAAVAPGKECPIDRSESEECGMEMCTAAGLSCSEYTLCTDCTDNGKTSPRRCQFCAKSGGVGVCQSLFVNDVDASGGLRACPIDFDARATTIAACSPGGAPASTATDGATTTTAAQVIETVDIRTVLKLGVNETTAQADVTLSGGIRLQVRVVGEQGAMLRALDNGIGVFSPSRDGTNSSNATSSAPAYGHVRAGLSVEFLFAKDRPVSFRRLSLGAWDDGDSAQVTISNDAFAAERRRDDTSVIVLVNQAEWTFDEKDTSAGFTKYALSAVGESDFTIKSFEFATAARAPSDAPRGTDDANAITEMQSGFQFDTITIALIAAGGAVCLLLVVGLIVCAVRRRKSKASSELSSDSTTKSLDDMRPALGTAEFTLASSNEYARPPVQQQPNTGDDFYNVLPVSQQHHQPPTNYKDLHVSPARASSYQDLRMPPPPSESDGVYQALPATPAISTYTPSLFGTMQSLSQGESDQGMYVNMPVAARYDAVGGNENFVQAIAGANNGAMPPPPLSPRGMYASSGLR